MTTLEYVKGLKIEDLNRIYNYLGEVSDYFFSTYAIREKDNMSRFLAGYDSDMATEMSGNDRFWYIDYENEDLNSFSNLAAAPYTLEDLAAGLEAEMADRDISLAELVEDIGLDLLDGKERAAAAIEAFYRREYDDMTTVEPAGIIPLAYTTLTDREIPIQVSVNLDTMKMLTFINDSERPREVIPVSTEDLLNMDFDSLIAGWQTWIEDNILPGLDRNI